MDAEEANKKECPRMTAEQIIDFAKAFVRGEVVTSQEVMKSGNPSLLAMVFMPVGLGGAPDKTGLIWASMRDDRTMGRAVNGFPMFATCRLMHLEDLPKCVEAIDRFKAAEKAVESQLEKGGAP